MARLWQVLVGGVARLVSSTYVETVGALPAAGDAGRTLQFDDSVWLDDGVAWVRQGPQVGEYKMMSHTSVDANWALCDGSTFSRTGKSKLFAKIGTTYGAGNGTTTANLPNYTSRFPMGNTPGATGGSNTSDLSHIHSVNPPPTASGAPSSTTNFSTLLGRTPAGNAGHTHTVDIPAFNSASGGNAAFDNRPAFLGMGIYIYTGSS